MTERQESAICDEVIKVAPKMGDLYRSLVNTGVPEPTAQQIVLETWRLLLYPPMHIEKP